MGEPLPDHRLNLLPDKLALGASCKWNYKVHATFWDCLLSLKMFSKLIQCHTLCRLLCSLTAE